MTPCLHHPNQKQNCTRSNYKTPPSKQGIGPVCTFTTDPSKRNRQIAGNCGNSKVGAFNLRSWRTRVFDDLRQAESNKTSFFQKVLAVQNRRQGLERGHDSHDSHENMRSCRVVAQRSRSGDDMRLMERMLRRMISRKAMWRCFCFS